MDGGGVPHRRNGRHDVRLAESRSRHESTLAYLHVDCRRLSRPAGTLFKGNPAIAMFGALGTDRADYFAYASNTADSDGGILLSMEIQWDLAELQAGSKSPSRRTACTINSSPSVALQGNTLYLAARGRDGGFWINTLSNATNSGTYGGPWSGWSWIGGLWSSAPAITAWDRGVDLYGIGTDNHLWHLDTDADGTWSGFDQLNQTFSSTIALTASDLLPSTHEINVFGMDAGPPPSPRITRYPVVTRPPTSSTRRRSLRGRRADLRWRTAAGAFCSARISRAARAPTRCRCSVAARAFYRADSGAVDSWSVYSFRR